MKIQRHPVAACTARAVRPDVLVVVAALLAAFSVTHVQAQAQAPAEGINAAAPLSVAELEQLVGRIALYPDDLVSLILPASTNPLQIVQADRFLAKRKTDPKAPVDEKWDDSVKSLLNYPEVVTQMSGDLDWTAALGEAVVADQAGVLGAVQAFRRKTQAAGNLKTDQKQVVVVEKEVIKIVPADPQVIYVPQYNPATVVVYGTPAPYAYYPNPYPVYYYPYAPGAAFATGLIWGAAISSAWNGNRYATQYGGNANINIDRNTNINTGNINTGNVRGGDRATQSPAGSSKWTPNKQPGQVSKSVGASPPARVGDTRASAGTYASGRSDAAGGDRSSAGTYGSGRSDAAAGGGRSSATAFDGYGAGAQTQRDSSRGAASRSSGGGGYAGHSSSRASASPAMRGGGGGGGRGRR